LSKITNNKFLFLWHNNNRVKGTSPRGQILFGLDKYRFYKNRRLILMSKNKVNVPEARAALDKFKMEAANEVGVTLKQGYNGDLTSRQAGSVGGQMVNDI
jgi:small acid-soluble spore protein D (minor alpha/beta-type SASP)